MYDNILSTYYADVLNSGIESIILIGNNPIEISNDQWIREEFPFVAKFAECCEIIPLPEFAPHVYAFLNTSISFLAVE
jgi:hypothetical protein